MSKVLTVKEGKRLRYKTIPALVFLALFLLVAVASPALAQSATGADITGQPSLMIDHKETYWASVADYLKRRLTVVTWLLNNGSTNAYDIVITDSQANNGVTLVSPVPVSLGDAPAGQRAVPYTMVYQLPINISDFQTVSPATARDGAGNLYSYSFVDQNHATSLPDNIP